MMKPSTLHIAAVAFASGLSVMPSGSHAETIYGHLCQASMEYTDPLGTPTNYGPHCVGNGGVSGDDFGWIQVNRNPDNSVVVNMKVKPGWGGSSSCSGTVACEGFFYKSFEAGTHPDHTDIITPNTWCEIDQPGSTTVGTCKWEINYYPVALYMACDCR